MPSYERSKDARTRSRETSKVLHQNQFENPMIRSAGQADAEAGFNIESAGVYVNNREQLVRLFGRGKKMAYAAKVVVFLERHLKGIGKFHGHPGSGYEFEAGKSSVRIIHDGIEDEIETADVSTDDGADLGCITPLVPA